MAKLQLMELYEQQGWFVVSFHDQLLTIKDRTDVSDWCHKTYGKPCKSLKTLGRWRDRTLDFYVYFHDEADRSLFVLKWG